MSIDYEGKSKEVLFILEREGYSAITVREHQSCLGEIFKHLSAQTMEFSMKTALEWLEHRKQSWSLYTYERYRRVLYRFEKYLLCGEINREPHCGKSQFAYHDKSVSYINLPENYKALYCEFYNAISKRFAQTTVNHYVAGCTDFLLFISEHGCKTPDDMTIEQPLKYLERIEEITCTAETQRKYANGVAQLLSFLSKQGLIPACYLQVMRKRDATAILSLRLRDAACAESSFHPSKPLEALAASFLASLEEQRYSIPPERAYKHIFKSFFLFLEINHMAYSKEAINLWLNHIPKVTHWSAYRQIITWFADYVETGNIERPSVFKWRPLLINSLPKWSREILENYLTVRKNDELSQSSLAIIRSTCARFFGFMDANGVNSPDAITPSLVKEFHNTLSSAAPTTSKAYRVGVRGLLKHMGEANLSPKNLYLAVPTNFAPRCEIVTVMSDDMINGIYDYRKNASNPLELRNAAMIMLGLRMGIRSCDIVNLKISDFDWANQTVSFIQKKTRKAITLHIPTDAGNSVYRYISQGRPQSGASSVGFVFIRHMAPYSELTNSVCGYAIKHALSAHGLKLPHRQGFHITRRTFATRLLKAGTRVDSIVDALGHTSRKSVDAYMAHDEEGMLLCPLSFTVGGAV